jgi:hypothetical protein
LLPEPASDPAADDAGAIAPQALRWCVQFADQPADIAGFGWIGRDRDLFDMIAPGAIERSKFKSGWPRQDARKRHARLAFWAAKPLNGEQRDDGWIIGHGPPPRIRRERGTPSHRQMPQRGGDAPTVRFRVAQTLVKIGQFSK